MSDQKLLQIRDIILGSEVKNVADNLESRSQSLSEDIRNIRETVSDNLKKVNSRIEDEKLLLINSIDYLKTEIEGLKQKLTEEIEKNQALIEKNRLATVSRNSFSKLLKEMSEHIKQEEFSVEPADNTPHQLNN